MRLFARPVTIVVVALACASPLGAQSKGNGKKDSQGKSAGAGTRLTPNQTVLPAPAVVAGPAATAPFAWLDNASLVDPGTLWLGISMVSWRGHGVSETQVPVVDMSLGLTPRVQIGATVPHVRGSEALGVEGSLGTSFFNAKINLWDDAARAMRVAVSPTLEILSRASMDASGNGARTHWGLPVSVDVDRSGTRYYCSAGYFSPGVWYTGVGAARQLSDRLGASLSFSRSWSSLEDPTIAGPRRNDLTGGGWLDLSPRVGVFGSIGRTLRTSDFDGAGTTFSVGISLTAAARTRTK